ncbi:MAG: YgiQ family radical SAM protein [Bacteroidaceae bacterium]|nr:YgiQ family radical SAM protein [Bacteroidaceae bacterium]
MSELKQSDWLPTTRREMDLRGWDCADVIIFSGDAYVDHPSFGAAVIGRLLESEGYRVCIVPQPDWHGDYRDFRKLGRPRLFFGVSPGCMDSMVNKYTAARRLRSEDAYSPNGRHDLRPEYPTIVYTRIIKELFPDAPVILGGIEASLRRLMHYDYWQDRFRPSVLVESGADMITYGMGEQPTLEVARRLLEAVESSDATLGYDENGTSFCTCDTLHQSIRHVEIPQTVCAYSKNDIPHGIREDDIVLHSYAESLANPRLHAENFRHIEEESNRIHAQRLLQETDGQWVVVTPPYEPPTQTELDRSYDLPYTRMPHPKYRGKRIPAYEMIRHSLCLHRGCFGGCAFCTISAHQGKFIVSRSKESILREAEKITQMPDFKGHISDLGGPSANMYMMGGKNRKACEACRRPSCIHPNVCPNLNVDHRPLLEIYRAVDALPAVKRSFIGSGVRYDLLLHDTGNPVLNESSRQYTEELITRHVSGRLKVAPEHTSDHVLNVMRKPSFALFHRFKSIFDDICRRHRLRQQIIPYFISSHPGCSEADMAELACETKRLDFHLEQVQDFTPTPMTLATTCWATGYHPYTGEKIFSARTPQEKQAQRMYFFWYKPEERRKILQRLKQLGRHDLIKILFNQ